MDKYNTRATIRNVSFLSTLITTTKDGKKRPSIRFWRIFTIILVHLLFVLSYRVDIQILEGDISASRIFGFHLADAFMSLQVFLVSWHFISFLVVEAFALGSVLIR